MYQLKCSCNPMQMLTTESIGQWNSHLKFFTQKIWKIIITEHFIVSLSPVSKQNWVSVMHVYVQMLFMLYWIGFEFSWLWPKNDPIRRNRVECNPPMNNRFSCIWRTNKGQSENVCLNVCVNNMLLFTLNFLFQFNCNLFTWFKPKEGFKYIKLNINYY